LVVPNEEELRSLVSELGIDATTPLDVLCEDQRVVSAVQRDLERYQRDLAKYERVRRIALIPEPFSIENGLLTPTLKVKRREIGQRYEALCERLYTYAE
jgi:long-chain acyl-CoA synthetase